MNKSTNAKAKVLLLLSLAVAGTAKAQDYEPIIQEDEKLKDLHFACLDAGCGRRGKGTRL